MIKMAIVGAGLWANEHARIFAEMDNVECVAICDVNREKADHLRQSTTFRKFITIIVKCCKNPGAMRSQL